MARKLSSKHRKAISEGLKRHHRGGGRKRKYSPAQKHALARSRYSKSGHKTWRQRQKTRRPGLWSNYWAKKHRKGYKRKKNK